MRLVIAECSVVYAGRLTAHLPLARRLLLVKADGSVLVHSDGGSYKPLNWMSPPCSLKISEPDQAHRDAGVTAVWTVQSAKTDDRLVVHLHEVLHDAEHVHTLGDGYTLVRREYPTAIGPVDLLVRDAGGTSVAVEIKRRGEIDGVEQLTRDLELLIRVAHLAPVSGVFAAQEI